MEPSLTEETRDAEGVARAAFDEVLRAAMGSFVSIFDSFTIADLAGDPVTGRIACLGCDLHTLVRNGREFSRLRRHLLHARLPPASADKVASQAA